MPINEENRENEKNDKTNVPKGQMPQHETTMHSSQTRDKFPKWDMLPPHQFINPRVKNRSDM